MIENEKVRLEEDDSNETKTNDDSKIQFPISGLVLIGVLIVCIVICIIMICVLQNK